MNQIYNNVLKKLIMLLEKKNIKISAKSQIFRKFLV